MLVVLRLCNNVVPVCAQKYLNCLNCIKSKFVTDITGGVLLRLTEGLKRG